MKYASITMSFLRLVEYGFLRTLMKRSVGKMSRKATPKPTLSKTIPTKKCAASIGVATVHAPRIAEPAKEAGCTCGRAMFMDGVSLGPQLDGCHASRGPASFRADVSPRFLPGG